MRIYKRRQSLRLMAGSSAMAIALAVIGTSGPSLAGDDFASNESAPTSGQGSIMPCSGSQKKKYSVCVNVFNNNAYDIVYGSGGSGAQLELVPLLLDYERKQQYSDDWSATSMEANTANQYNSNPWSSMSRSDADSLQGALDASSWSLSPASGSQLNPSRTPFSYAVFTGTGSGMGNLDWSPPRGPLFTNSNDSWNPSHNTKYAYNHSYGFKTLPLMIHVSNGSNYELRPVASGADGGNFLPSYALGRGTLETGGTIPAQGSGYAGGFIYQVASTSDLYPQSNYQLSFYNASPAPTPSASKSSSPSPTNTDFPDRAGNGATIANFVIDLNVVMERSNDGGMSFADSYCSVVGKTSVHATCTIVGLPKDNSTSFLQPTGWSQINVEIKGS